MKVEALSGVVYIDEYGDQTENPSAPVERYDDNSFNNSGSKWELVLLIILIGAVSGLGVVKLVRKLEKRYD